MDDADELLLLRKMVAAFEDGSLKWYRPGAFGKEIEDEGRRQAGLLRREIAHLEKKLARLRELDRNA